MLKGYLASLIAVGISFLDSTWLQWLHYPISGGARKKKESVCLKMWQTLQLVGTNYQHTLLKYVDKENLPEYLGGSSKATLLDDVGPWKNQNLIDEIDADFKAALSEASGPETGIHKILWLKSL